MASSVHSTHGDSVALLPPRLARSLAHLTEAEANTFLDVVTKGARIAGAVLPVLAPVAPVVSLARKAVNAIRNAVRKRPGKQAAAPRARPQARAEVAPAGSATILLSGLLQSRSVHQAVDRLALGDPGGQPIPAGATHLSARAILGLIHHLSAQALRELGMTPRGGSNLAESLHEVHERDESWRAGRTLDILRAEEALWSATAAPQPVTTPRWQIEG